MLTQFSSGNLPKLCRARHSQAQHFLVHWRSVFLVIRSQYTTCMPTRGSLRETTPLQRVPTRARVSLQVPTRTPTRANVQFKCTTRSSTVQFWQKITCAGQVRTPNLCKDLDARNGLRSQNALKAYANADPGPTQSLRKDCRTNRRNAKEQAASCLANSFAQKCLREAYPRGDTTAYAQKPARAYAPQTRIASAKYMQFPFVETLSFDLISPFLGLAGVALSFSGARVGHKAGARQNQLLTVLNLFLVQLDASFGPVRCSVFSAIRALESAGWLASQFGRLLRWLAVVC